MPVRLIQPYMDQAANTLYWGADQATIRAMGIADDRLDLASDYGQGRDRVVTTSTAVVSMNATTYRMNSASAQTLTLNPTGYLPKDTVLTVIQMGAGATTITAGPGVTIMPGYGLSGLVTQGVNYTFQLTKGAGETWVASAVGGGVGIPSGASFPGSPATNDLFFRTDRGIVYFYDGTRWLSVEIFTVNIAAQDKLLPTALANEMDSANPFWNEYDVYVLRVKLTSFNSATTAANYFSVQFKAWDGATQTNLGSAISTQNDTQNAYVGHDAVVNSVISATYDAFTIACAPTGSPACYLSAALKYRAIG